MTAKEKAMEIAMKFDKYGQTDNAVKCALICVDEFIDALSFNSSPTAEGLTEFYEKVKEEINKL